MNDKNFVYDQFLQEMARLTQDENRAEFIKKFIEINNLDAGLLL
jgi:hypothetical protein